MNVPSVDRATRGVGLHETLRRIGLPENVELMAVCYMPNPEQIERDGA